MTSDLKMLGAPDLDDAQLSLDAQATARLSLALNHLTPTLAPPEALGSLMAAIERPGLTFEQLSGGADLRRELEESDDPQLPYTLVSARTPLVADALKKEDDGTSLVTRLVARLSLSSTVDADALAGLLFEAAGEEASAREASTRLKSFGAAERQPPLRVVAVECDELSFFNCEEALELLVAEAPREGGEG